MESREAPCGLGAVYRNPDQNSCCNDVDRMQLTTRSKVLVIWAVDARTGLAAGRPRSAVPARLPRTGCPVAPVPSAACAHTRVPT